MAVAVGPEAMGGGVVGEAGSFLWRCAVMALAVMVPLGASAVGGAAVSARATGAAPLVGAQKPGSLHGAARHELPVAAAGPVSRILGRDEPGYLVVRADGGFVARNRAQRLAARFSAAGVTLHSGGLLVGMRLRGYGYGSQVMRVAARAPSALANRVVYRNGPLTQWYANGPLGLEQGYTLAAPPPRSAALARGGWLAFALGVTGGARMAVAHGTVVFSGKGESLAYRGLVATDALGRRLPARVTVAKRGVLLWVDDAGARYPVRVDPLFQQQAKLTGSDSGAFDGLGFSVAISGGTVVAGAPFASSGPKANQGAVYVFTEPAGGWANETQAAKLTASDGAASDELGSSVAVSGGTVVAGAPGAAVGGHPSQVRCMCSPRP